MVQTQLIVTVAVYKKVITQLENILRTFYRSQSRLGIQTHKFKFNNATPTKTKRGYVGARRKNRNIDD